MTDIRWRGVSHEQLYQWINSGEGPRASTPQLEFWKGLGQSLADIHGRLTDRLGKLSVSWQGHAGSGAQRAVNPLQRWADDAQGHVRAMGRVAQNQADLIASARAQMPEPQPHPQPQPAAWGPRSGHAPHGGRGPAAVVAAQGTDLEIVESRAVEARERAIEVMGNYQRASESNRGGLGMFEEPGQVGVEVPGPRRTVTTMTGHGSASPATRPRPARHAASGVPEGHGAPAASGAPATAGGQPARPVHAGGAAGGEPGPATPPEGVPGRTASPVHTMPGGGWRPVPDAPAAGVTGTVAGVGAGGMGVGVAVGGARIRARSGGGKHRAAEPGDLPAGVQPGTDPAGTDLASTDPAGADPAGQDPPQAAPQPLQPAQHTAAAPMPAGQQQPVQPQGQSTPSPQVVTPQSGPAHTAAAVSPDVAHPHGTPVTPAAPAATPMGTGGAGGGMPAGQDVVRAQSPLMRGATAGYQGFSGQGGFGEFGGQTHPSAAGGYGSGATGAGGMSTGTPSGGQAHAAGGYGQHQGAAGPAGYGELEDGFAEPASDEGGIWSDDRPVAPPVLGEDPPR